MSFFRVYIFSFRHKDAKSGIYCQIRMGENPELKPEETFLILAISWESLGNSYVIIYK